MRWLLQVRAKTHSSTLKISLDSSRLRKRPTIQKRANLRSKNKSRILCLIKDIFSLKRKYSLSVKFSLTYRHVFLKSIEPPLKGLKSIESTDADFVMTSHEICGQVHFEALFIQSLLTFSGYSLVAKRIVR